MVYRVPRKTKKAFKSYCRMPAGNMARLRRLRAFTKRLGWVGIKMRYGALYNGLDTVKINGGL